MKKTIGELIDSLAITNNKIFYLIDKVQKDEHTREDAKKIQDLNKLWKSLRMRTTTVSGQILYREL